MAGGGPVETLCDVDDPWGGSWPEDNVIIFSLSRAEGLVTQRVPAAGGEPNGVQLESSGGGTNPLWSRDGRRLHFHSSKRLKAVDVELGESVGLGQPRRVLSEPTFRVVNVAADERLRAIQSEPMPEVTTLNVILSFDRLLKDLE